MPQERLWRAVDALAASALPIQQRLLHAAENLAPLRRDDFEPGDRDEFTSIMDALTATEPVDDEGTLRATTASLSDGDAVEIASRIVAFDGVYRPLG